jgi:hypothetical protein
MHFSARSALLASCLAIAVQALPVTYSVVDVDGGSAANGANGPADQPATIYQTVTKSQDVEEPEPTTVSVSVSVTIVETQHASATSTSTSSSSSSLSSSISSQQASAQASSPASSPTATPTSTQDALSVLESAKSTFLTSHTSVVWTPSAKPTITQAPSPSSASQASSSSTEECDASSVTVTAEVTDAEETVTATKVSSEFSTVVLLSTTTITPSAAPTSYYDDGMWHTRYAIKPAASPSPVIPAVKDDDAAPNFDKPSKPVDDKTANANPNAATNATSQTGNSTYHARREVDPVAPSSTAPAVAADSVPEVSDAPLMLVQPLREQAPGITAPSDASTADAAASGDVLSTDDDLATSKAAKREATYNVVSWNETTEG